MWQICSDCYSLLTFQFSKKTKFWCPFYAISDTFLDHFGPDHGPPLIPRRLAKEEKAKAKAAAKYARISLRAFGFLGRVFALNHVGPDHGPPLIPPNTGQGGES